MTGIDGLKDELDKLYSSYNDRKFIHPDPLEFLYDYENIEDREISGLIAAVLAYGKVAQILKSVKLVLERMTPGPYLFLKKSSPDMLYDTFKDFKHRFTTGHELFCLLTNIKNTITRYGTLNKCFLRSMKEEEKTVHSAVLDFAKNLNFSTENRCDSLIPSPMGGSAFKRLNLYLRWMVRKDNVDPGGWTGISRSKLIIPLDTHMYRISFGLGFTVRKQADIKTALEITDALRKFDERDPVKYDFALTRLGMNNIYGSLLKKYIKCF